MNWKKAFGVISIILGVIILLIPLGFIIDIRLKGCSCPSFNSPTGADIFIFVYVLFRLFVGIFLVFTGIRDVFFTWGGRKIKENDKALDFSSWKKD